MSPYTLFLYDPNALRAAAFAAVLTPWAHRAEVELRIAQDADDMTKLPDLAATACLYPIGGTSLRHPGVMRTIARLRGISACSPLIVFSDVADNAEIAAAIEGGLQGFIPTTMPANVAIAAIQFIINGGTYHPPLLGGTPGPAGETRLARIEDARAAAPGPSRSQPAAWSARQPCHADPGAQRLDAVTKRRHIEVLEFLAKGETNKEIARHLHLTEATIKVYVRELMRHFSAKNRMQVALRASALAEPHPDCPEDDAGDSPPGMGTGAARLER